jgi:hypothetical protein
MHEIIGGVDRVWMTKLFFAQPQQRAAIVAQR